MKYTFLLFSSLTFWLSSVVAQANLQADTMYIRCTQTLDFAAAQANRLIKSLPAGTKLPSCTNSNGDIVLVNASSWTSGFFPGELWYLSNYKTDAVMQADAKKYTQLLQAQQFTTTTHDLGFMMYCSYGNGLRFANVAGYNEILIQSAKSLQTRFNSKVGCMRSWNSSSWTFPVIIDNMMNLELMFWATHVTGDSVYYKGAVSHALTTIKNHFRPDFSSFHLVDYNATTGEIIGKQTVQGYSNQSSWARGQAWGLYGFTMLYNETKMDVFLVQAKRIADYILKNLPVDNVFYWDYNDPAIPNAPRDASSAAVTASALLELFRFTDEIAYQKAAEKIIWNLSTSKYMNGVNENQNFLLKHSTGNKPGNSQVDVPLIYADYYFVEALYRYVKLKKTASSVPEINLPEESFQIYQNSVEQILTIQSATCFNKVQLIDVAGKVLTSKSFSGNTSKISIILENYNKGIYFIKVYFSNKSTGVKKFIYNKRQK
jgi:hypothetical protein